MDELKLVPLKAKAKTNAKGAEEAAAGPHLKRPRCGAPVACRGQFLNLGGCQ
jgi:hypothetical protein